MIRLRLLIALLVGMSMGVSSEVVQACAYTYDGPQLARVADGVTIAVGGALPPVSGPSSGRVERWSVTLGSSTTSSRTFIATNNGERTYDWRKLGDQEFEGYFDGHKEAVGANGRWIMALSRCVSG